MEENNAHYKWRKLFAAKRYNTKEGVIRLSPLEQQELLDDIKPLVKNNGVLDELNGSKFIQFNESNIVKSGVYKVKTNFDREINCEITSNKWFEYDTPLFDGESVLGYYR